MKKERILLMVLFLGAILFFGCLETGNESDKNTSLVGSDKDEHRCIGSAGYSWCEPLQKCIRPWEENCTPPIDIKKEAESFCGNENVAAVYVCGPYIRVVSSLIGGGSTFYENGKIIAQCPVVGPDSMSEECKTLLLGNNCIEEEINCPVFDLDTCIKNGTNFTMAIGEAMEIGKEICTTEGNYTGDYYCNQITGTWWIKLDIQKPGCNPACVVTVDTMEAEINWMCTGAE
ncbi:MAG: hypothetical protein WC501_00120 [Candidatus Micrarchaeia archaeon]